MNKLSTLALIAALGLAAPAFAQTPADIKNGRADAPVSEPAQPAVHKEKQADKKAVAAKPAKKAHHKKKAAAAKDDAAKTESK